MQSRFIVMSDTHFEAPEAQESPEARDWSWWNRMLFSKKDAIADTLIATVKRLAPDFVVHCGDFTTGGDLESFRLGRQVMDSLGCPYYVALGNHDTHKKGTRQAVSLLLENGEGKFYYARDLGGIRFIFLDCAYWITEDGQAHEHFPDDGEYVGIGPSREELDWLQYELESDGDVLTFAVTHPPLTAKPTYRVGTWPVCEEMGSIPASRPLLEAGQTSSERIGYSERREELLRLLGQSRNVKAVLAGHWHVFDSTFSDGILHCQTGSLIEFPLEMRLVQVDSQRFSITTVGLDDPSLRAASLVPEWKNAWVEGESGDREVHVSLA